MQSKYDLGSRRAAALRALPESLQQPTVLALIELSLAEDLFPEMSLDQDDELALRDLTSASILQPEDQLTAKIFSKENGVVAGLPLAEAVFKFVDPQSEFQAQVSEGVKIAAGQVLALVSSSGAGWNKAEYDACGIPFDHRVDRFEEALQIINPLLKEGHVDFEGKYYQARNCEIRPRSPRPAGPPLMIGSFGPRMLHLTAKYAHMWNTCYLHQPASLDEPLAKLLLACQDAGRDPNTLEITALVALAYPDLGEQPQSMDEWLSGTKEEIAAAIQGYEAAGVSHLMFHCQPYKREALDRLAESVALYHQA